MSYWFFFFFLMVWTEFCQLHVMLHLNIWASWKGKILLGSVTVSIVVADFAGSEYQSPWGSCSHSTTWHTYEPLSEILACRIVNSKAGPSAVLVLIRCLDFSSVWGPNVTRAFRSKLNMVLFSALSWSSQVTANWEDAEDTAVTEHFISMSELVFCVMSGLEDKASLLARRGRQNLSWNVRKERVSITVLTQKCFRDGVERRCWNSCCTWVAHYHIQ